MGGRESHERGRARVCSGNKRKGVQRRKKIQIILAGIQTGTRGTEIDVPSQRDNIEGTF